jgi:hypothetical protein
MGGEPADIFFLNEKKGSRERHFSPNQLNQLNQLNPANQVNEEIETASISKGPQFYFRALGPIQLYLPLRAANAL